MKYRYESKQRFQTVRSYQQPSRLPNGFPLLLEGPGPTRNYVDLANGWAWRKPGGDWIDTDGVLWGPKAWFSVNAKPPASALSSPAARRQVSNYSVDVTAAMRRVFADDRPNDFLLRCAASAPRVIAGIFGSDPKPQISVVYADGSTDVLECLIVAMNSQSTIVPVTSSAAAQLPCFIEFRRPGQEVKAATMTFTIVEHWSALNSLIEGFLLEPEINTKPVVAGLAALLQLDAGITSVPGVIGAHRYEDSRPQSDFFGTLSGNTDDEQMYSPEFWGGKVDITKFPYADAGKWASVGTGMSVVPSTYRNEGFEPLAPGLGALRVFMPKTPGIKDGATVGYGGTLAATARIFMPPARYGKQKRLFVRYYFRLGTPNGTPYRMPIGQAYQVIKGPGSFPVWTDCAGKFGIAPSHAVTTGGVSGSSGGGFGWQMRNSWADCKQDDTGPDVGGLCVGLHTYDFQTNNPPGYRYVQDTPHDSSLGQQGGLGGTWYANNWYCVEMELDLNSVPADGSAGFTPDGAVRMWIDGRLAIERTGMVFRTLPLWNPGFRAGYSRPCGNLGIKDLWLNFFHGGLTQDSIDRTHFYAGLVWSEQYIGPMNLAGPGDPQDVAGDAALVARNAEHVAAGEPALTPDEEVEFGAGFDAGWDAQP